MNQSARLKSRISAVLKALALVGAIAGAVVTIGAALQTAIAGPTQKIVFDGKAANGEPLKLTGILTKPRGAGPFPAVVDLHGCSGIWPDRDLLWVTKLAGWGYVVLQVESYIARGRSNVCDRPWDMSGPLIARDAHAAKSHLAGLAFVDGDRIAVMGFSNGGWATLAAVDDFGGLGGDPFRAAVALYPWCLDRLVSLDAPLLILIGEADDWTPASRCETMLSGEESAHEVTLIVYPGTTHAFDVEGYDTNYLGHRMRYNPDATADAVARVRGFLAKHLR